MQVGVQRSGGKHMFLKSVALVVLLPMALMVVSARSVGQDPFGSISVTWTPSLLYPGLTGVKVRIGIEYPGSGVVNITTTSTNILNATGEQYLRGEQTQEAVTIVESKSTQAVERLEDVLIVLEPQDPFSCENTQAYIGTIAPGSSGIGNFYLNISDDAAPGEYILSLTVDYHVAPSNFTGTAIRAVSLFVNERPASLMINAVSAAVRSGSVSEIEIQLVNKGGAARSIVARIVPSPGIPVNPIGTEQHVTMIGSNQEANISLSVRVDREAEGNYPVALEITYTDPYGSHTQVDYFTATIRKGVGPFVVLSNETESPIQVFLGEIFPWKFGLYNAGSEVASRLVLSVESSQAFATVGNVSSLFLGSLEPGESLSGAMQFLLNENALPGLYTTKFVVEYADSYGETYTREGTISVQAVGAPELYIDEISVDPAEPVQGEDAVMTISLVNAGTDMARDIVVRVLGGQNLVGSPTKYLGEIRMKDTANVMFPISIGEDAEPGVYLQNITFTYADAYNNTYALFRLFEITVRAPPETISSFYLALGGGIAASVVFVYLLIRWPGMSPHPGEPRVNAEGTEEPSIDVLGRSSTSYPRLRVAFRVAVCILAISLYVFLLLPFVIHVNLDSGIVLESRPIELESLPVHIREMCALRGISSPSLLMVEHRYPDWSTMVISTKNFLVGDFVELHDYVVNWRVDWRDFGFANRLLERNYVFDRFAITNVRRLSDVESAFENLLLGPSYGELLYMISEGVFYAGPVMLTLFIAFFLQRRLALWNLPAMFAFYSFEVWRLNTVMIDHGLYVPTEMVFFGYAFVACIPAILYLWRFERKPLGRKIAEKLKTLSLG